MNTVLKTYTEEYFTYSYIQMAENITIIGSTGSVGRQTLEVIKNHPAKWRVFALAAYSNVELLTEQIIEFKPKIVAIFDQTKVAELEAGLTVIPKSKRPEIVTGVKGWETVCIHPETEKIVFASSGVTALPALYKAIEADKKIALANKEMIVEEGEKIMAYAKKHGVQIIPIDSEHSAIFQCLQGEDPGTVEKLILTCSGGPFYGKSKEELAGVTVKDALNHPKWKMGDKISIDSATLMNKALEIIEASYLFGISEDKIEVVIHPECIVHSLVQFKDGSVKAQLGMPDMKIPITYALSYPQRIHAAWPRMNLADIGSLTFKKYDPGIFKGPDLAHMALRKKGKAPAELNRTNNHAVKQFIKGEIVFAEVYDSIENKLKQL